jgi:hypothetical protein
VFLAFILCNFSVRMLKKFENKLKYFFAHKKLKKTTPKSCILMAVGSFFLSVILTAKKTAQSSPELHLRFSNTFIQSSLLESLSLICNIIKIGGDLTGFQLSLAQITVLNICLPTVQRLIVIE